MDGPDEGGCALDLAGFASGTPLKQGLGPDFLEDVLQQTAGCGGLADAAGQCPQGDGERDPVRIETSLVGVGSGGSRPGDLDKLIDDQQRVEFLCHTVRVLGTQNVLPPAQVGLQVRVPGLTFPPFVVELRYLLRWRRNGIQQRSDEQVRLGAGLALLGHGVTASTTRIVRPLA